MTRPPLTQAPPSSCVRMHHEMCPCTGHPPARPIGTASHRRDCQFRPEAEPRSPMFIPPNCKLDAGSPSTGGQLAARRSGSDHVARRRAVLIRSAGAQQCRPSNISRASQPDARDRPASRWPGTPTTPEEPAYAASSQHSAHAEPVCPVLPVEHATIPSNPPPRHHQLHSQQGLYTSSRLPKLQLYMQSSPEFPAQLPYTVSPWSASGTIQSPTKL